METQRLVDVYEQIARRYDLEGENQIRDRFLLLAAMEAHDAGHGQRAEELRERILARNPHHLLQPFGSMVEACRSPDVLTYVQGLQRTYPAEEAEGMLERLEGGRVESLPITLRPDRGSPQTAPAEPLDSPPNTETQPIPTAAALDKLPGWWVIEVLRVLVALTGLSLLLYTLFHP